MKDSKIKDLCFEIIEKCPNNCIFCSSRSDMSKCHQVDFETFKDVINFFQSKGGMSEISFSGGEPLLHKNIYEMIKFCHDIRIKTTLYTSGILIRENRFHSDNIHIQKILDQLNDFREISKDEFATLQNCGLDKIVFDFQASEVEEYNLLMGTSNNMSHIIKSLVNVSYFKFEKSIHFVPNKINISQFPDILEIAELTNIDELRILRFVPQGRGLDNKNRLLLAETELENFLSNIIKLKTSKTKIKIGIPLTKNNTHICSAGKDKIVIRYDGQILPCPAFKDVDINLLEKLGCHSVNIYDNLNDFTFSQQNHTIPLCSQLDRHK